MSNKMNLLENLLAKPKSASTIQPTNNISHIFYSTYRFIHINDSFGMFRQWEGKKVLSTVFRRFRFQMLFLFPFMEQTTIFNENMNGDIQTL